MQIIVCEFSAFFNFSLFKSSRVAALSAKLLGGTSFFKALLYCHGARGGKYILYWLYENIAKRQNFFFMKNTLSWRDVFFLVVTAEALNDTPAFLEAVI